MNLDFTPQQLQFREQVRDWLQAHKPSEPRPEDGAEGRAFDLAWQKTLYTGGWAGINWPKAYGGQGFDTFQQLIFLMEYAKSGAPGDHYRFNGLNLAGPTIIACGDEEQRKTHLHQEREKTHSFLHHQIDLHKRRYHHCQSIYHSH